MDSSRACDSCRSRKVRCDRSYPCSNCRSSGLTCRTTSARAPEPRARVLVSAQYEKKIDRIEHRLSSLETTLKTIAESLKSGPSTSLASAPAPQFNTRITVNDQTVDDPPDTDDEDSTFEGASSLAAHVAQANELLGDAVKSVRNTDMTQTVNSLRRIASRRSGPSSRKRSTFRPYDPILGFSASALQLPPSEVVMLAIKDRKDKLDKFFEIAYPFANLEDFVEMLKSIYFDDVALSTAKGVMIFGSLYYIFETTLQANHAQQDHMLHLAKYVDLCKVNFETCLDHLLVLLPANDESFHACSMGVSYAVKTPRPSLAWTLSTAAASLAKGLGYHRHETRSSDERENAKRTYSFWCLYLIEKSLSLRLGRASNLPDFDISLSPTQLPLISTSEASQSWSMMMALWIRFAAIQGDVYEQLYSPGALRVNIQERTSRANKLSNRLMLLQAEWTQIDIESIGSAPGLRHVRALRRADATMHMSTQTLIHCAVSMPSKPNSTCIDLARATLAAHQETYDLYHKSEPDLWEGYLTWAVIHAPFTPYLVLFCHVINTRDTQDLERLGQFMSSLTQTSQRDGTIARFHRLCNLFYQVAVLYCSSVADETSNKSTDMWPEMDDYLTTLGFGTKDDIAQFEGLKTIMNPEFGHTSHSYVPPDDISSWFQSTQYMAELLDQDFSYLNDSPM